MTIGNRYSVQGDRIHFCSSADSHGPGFLLMAAILAAACLSLGGCERETSRIAAVQTTVPATQSVCSLFRDLGAYAGRRVQVRGVYYSGLRQHDCGWRFMASGKEWPFAVDLVDADSYSEEVHPPAFATDRASWDELNRVTIRQGLSGKKAEIWVTVVGTLRGPAKGLLPNGGAIGGYGHLGVYPAQIVAERIHSIEVLATPTYDYATILPPHLRSREK